MAKMKIDVEVVYRVSLSEVEIDDDMAQLFVNHNYETINMDTCDKDETKVLDWITDHIHENDCYDYEATIEQLYINNEPY